MMILSQSSSTGNQSITSVHRYPDLGVVTLEFKKKSDSDIILLLDDVHKFADGSID